MESQQKVTENSNLEGLKEDYNELKLIKVKAYLQENFNNILKDDYDLDSISFDVLEILKDEDFINEKEEKIINNFIEYSVEKQYYLKEDIF